LEKRMLEDNFDIGFVADLARREKQIQQTYRPYIAVHKWFARRPGTLFRALLLSEFSDVPLRDSFFSDNDLGGRIIADPFMGGGTPLMEANRLGADIVGCDINPMSYWIVGQQLADLDLSEYLAVSERLVRKLQDAMGDLLVTRCGRCGSEKADVKYFLWVKTVRCPSCARRISLFPGYVLSRDLRHPCNVLVCSSCGQLAEVRGISGDPGPCPHCGEPLRLEGPVRRGRAICPDCGEGIRLTGELSAPLDHRLFAMEYHCPCSQGTRKGRLFKVPDGDDLRRLSDADIVLGKIGHVEKFRDVVGRDVKSGDVEHRGVKSGDVNPREVESGYAENREAQSGDAKYRDVEYHDVIPDDVIPDGDESARLHKWGYSRYSQLFNSRQLVGLATSARFIRDLDPGPVRDALATGFSDLLRYQNMLCRYDHSVLKSLDVFSIHGFPVNLIQCESNFIGVKSNGKLVGSGGWKNVMEKFHKAKSYCITPFETKGSGRSRRKIVMDREFIGVRDCGPGGKTAELHCGDSREIDWGRRKLDGVFTDPPYFGNVQYAELMDFCYVWLRRILGDSWPFSAVSTRNPEELTVNESMNRGQEHFSAGLAGVYAKVASALKPGAPFVFTYHSNNVRAYFPVVTAILDAGLICTRVYPCPSEMGASIHINGTGSSVIDTVFVCRGRSSQEQPESGISPDFIMSSYDDDIRRLNSAGIMCSDGDRQTIRYGYSVYHAVNLLARRWDPDAAHCRKILAVTECFRRFADGCLPENFPDTAR
jgi:adenine-specific DNA methylase